jgi:hypothetical protein
MISFINAQLKKLDTYLLVKNHSVTKAISFILIVVSLLLAFFVDQIGLASRTAATFLIDFVSGKSITRYSPNYISIVFWILQIVYIIFSIRIFKYQQIINEQKDVENKRLIEETSEAGKSHMNIIKDEIRSAIFNAPNPDIFVKYQFLLAEIIDDIQNLNFFLKTSKGENTPLNERVEICQGAIVPLLARIAEFAKYFANKPDAMFGSNIMQYIHNIENINNQKIDEIRADESRHSIYFHEFKTSHLRGILISDLRLMHPGIKIQEGKTVDRMIPAVLLPILIEKSEDKEIPGACKALTDNATVVVNDLLDEKNYGAEARKKGMAFFAGQGKDIRSVISITIPRVTPYNPQDNNNATIIGVLNIDCSLTYPLGKDLQFLDTFKSLLKPISYILAHPFQEYIDTLERIENKDKRVTRRGKK